MPLALHLHTGADSRPPSTVPPPSQASHHPIKASRLRNLFTPNKSATFAVTVTIHSVQNIPQVQGYFSVGWKFRDGEGGGRAKVDVKAANIKNDISGNLPSKPPLPIPRNMIPGRRSLDSVDSRNSSAASSTMTVDDYNVSGTSPISPGAKSFSSITGALSPLSPIPSDASSFHGNPPPPTASKRRSTDSFGNRTEISSTIPGSTATSITSSRRTSDTSTEGPLLRTLHDGSNGNVDSEEWAESSGNPVLSSDFGNEQDPAATSAPQPSRLTVPIQHSRSTRRQANSMRQASTSSLRSSIRSVERDPTSSHTALPVLVDSISVPVNTVSERQGCTTIATLRNHSCEWGCTVTQLVRMKIHPLTHDHHTRTTRPPLPDTPPLGVIGSGPRSESGLKLKVWQHIRPPTSDETQTVERGSMKHRGNGRIEDSYEFGGMNLDLAEFVGEEIRRAGTAAAVGPTVVPGVGPSVGMGGVTRRYLLTERAKTNATIKLTIDIKQVAGETNYVAPILQKRHIVAGLADFADEEPIAETHHHLPGLHLTRSNASSNSEISALSTNSRTPSFGNLRLTSTASNSTTCTLATERIVPSPMTRLKKLPEEHLLKPPGEITKSSLAAGKDHKKATTTALNDTREHAGTPSESEKILLSQGGGNETVESSDTIRSARSAEGDGATRSETTGHSSSQKGHAHKHSRKSISARAHRHQHHPHHSVDPEATPERIAEAVFNPKPSNVYTPFTYVVEPTFHGSLRNEGRRPRSLVLSDGKYGSVRGDEDNLDNCPTTASTATTHPPDSADEGSDATPTGPHLKWAGTTPQQPHAREQARWNATEGIWERRRGRGYGKMRTMPRRRVRDIERPFFKRIGQGEEYGVSNEGLGARQAVHV